jgi:hypothetical protein
MGGGDATLRIKQYGEKHPAVKDSGEPQENRIYLLEFKSKFEKPSDSE